MIDAELSDFKDRKHFCILRLLWRMLAIPIGYEIIAIVWTHRSSKDFVSTSDRHGLKNESAYIPSTVPTLLIELIYVMKAWIDDFIIHAKTASELLNHLGNVNTYAANIIYASPPRSAHFSP